MRAPAAATIGLLIALISASALAADVQMSVSSRSISLDEDVTLEIHLQGAYDRVQEPSLDDWEVTGQSSRSQISMIGPNVSKELILTKSLVPRKAGKLTIGQVRLFLNGAVVGQGGPIQVTVQEPKPVAPTTPGRASDLAQHTGEPFFILPVISEQHIYQGQPFVVSFDLWVRANVRAESRGFGDVPKYDGFLVDDILQGQNPQSRRRLGNQMYSVVTLKRDILTPLEPGRAVIDPIEMLLVAGDIFSQRRYSVKSDPVELQVLPVPTKGRPPEFRDGNVGQFTVEAELSKSAPTAGERLVLGLVVKGEGNLRGLKAPAIPPIAGATVEPLPGNDEDGIEKDSTGVHGTIRFNYVITPSRPGALTVPAVPLVYFDPRAESFGRAETRPIHLDVAAAHRVADGTGDDASMLKPIVTGVRLTSRPAENDGPTTTFWALLALPMLVWFGVETRHAVTRRRQSQAGRIRSKHALRTAFAELRKAEGKMRQKQNREFWGAVTHALNGYIEDRLGLPAQGMTHDTLRAHLVQGGASDELASGIITELENCDFARFAPASSRDEEMRRSLDRAGKLLEQLEQAVGKAEGKKEARDAA